MKPVALYSCRIGAVSLFIALAFLLSLDHSMPKRSFSPPEKRDSFKKDFYDSPYEAMEWYRLKRLEAGQTEIPAERYLTALEEAKKLSLYSTATSTFEPNQLGSWTELGPGNIGGRTRSLVIDPVIPDPADPNSIIMYAGGVTGGMWKSTNGGATWIPKGDLMPNIGITCTALTVSGNNRIIYAGTGEFFPGASGIRGIGIYKSTNGDSFELLSSTNNNPDFHYVTDIVIKPSSSGQTVYAATWTGVFRSTNGGSSWTKVLTPSNGSCYDLAIGTNQAGDYILAADFNKIYRSTSGNSGSWSVVNDDSQALRTSLAIAPSDQNYVYALVSASQDSQNSQNAGPLRSLLRSTNGGASWTVQISGPPSTSNLGTLLLSDPLYICFPQSPIRSQGVYDNVIAVDPTNRDTVWAGGIDLFRSNDGGLTWRLASHWRREVGTFYAHADQHVIVFHPTYNGTTNKTMFVGNDGGIYRTGDALAGTITLNSACDFSGSGMQWTSLNNGYGVTQFYHGLPYPGGNTFFGGAQDNGTIRGNAGGPNAWNEIVRGDGMYVAIDRSNTNVLYAEAQFGAIQKSTDNGQTFFPVRGGTTQPLRGINEALPFVTAYVMDPSNPNRLWLGGNYMWRTDDGAGRWMQAGSALGGITALAVAPNNPNIVLAGTFNGNLYVTQNGTAAPSIPDPNNPPNPIVAPVIWATLPMPRGTAFISSVAFDPADTTANTIFVTYSTFGGRHIYKSTNRGQNWSHIEGSGLGRIPDVPVHCIAIDPNNSSRLYIGTDIGVFSSLDGGTSWARENTGFANVDTEWLCFDTNAGITTLFAFTHGRGVWKVVVSTQQGRLTGTPFGTGPAFAPGREYDKAFDGNTATYDDDVNANGAYTGIDLGAGNARRVIRLRYYPRTDSELGPGRMVGGKFQGSNTSQTSGYVDLHTITTVPPFGWVEVIITDSTQYRYLRYLSPDGGYCNVAEIEFYSN